MAFPTLTNPDWLENSTREELESLVIQINGFLGIEHQPNGTHGDVTATSVTTTGNVTVGGDLTVTDDATITDDLTVSGDLFVTGDVKLSAGLALPTEDTVSVPSISPGDLGSTPVSPGVVMLRINSNGGGGLAGIPTVQSNFPAGLTGRVHLLLNDTADSVPIYHNNGGSSATLRFALPESQTHVLRTDEVIGVWRDDTDSRWRVFGAQPAVTPITHSDALYTGDGTDANWVVDSADQVAAWYRLDGDLLTLNLTVSASNVAGTPTELRYTLPNSWTVATRADSVGWASDAGAANQLIRVVAAAGNAYVSAIKIPAAAWTNTTGNNTSVVFQIQIPVTL